MKFGKTKELHFIGIGGIGMSGMAELLLNQKYKVSGSDLNFSERVKRLKKLGAEIYLDHSCENIKMPDVVIYSSAVNNQNPEIIAAKNKKIPVIRRAEMLGELLKIKSTSVAVAGSHGKTTTSSMLGSILFHANLNPTLIIGGIVNEFGSNSITGKGDCIVVEADEFDRSFLMLQPTYSIINNLDEEHMDCYENFEDLRSAFIDFANSVPFYGSISICIDSANVRSLINDLSKPFTTYAISRDADFVAQDIKFSNNDTEFNLVFDNKKIKLQLKVPGLHNVYNALGAISVACHLGVNIDDIKLGLAKYTGVKRRFDVKFDDKVIIVDDYAHHPEEISATIEAAKSGWNRRVVVIFQPHLFTRTENFHLDFARALSKSDIVFITDIFPAREKPIKGVTSQLIIDDLKEIGFNAIYYIKDQNQIIDELIGIIKDGDMMITMGAGDIWKQNIQLCEYFKSE